MIAAARALAEHSPALKDTSAPLLPVLKDIRSVAVEIAFAVAREAETLAALRAWTLLPSVRASSPASGYRPIPLAFLLSTRLVPSDAP